MPRGRPAPDRVSPMTESDWQTSADGDELLDHAAHGLTPRQWGTAAAAHVRRLWDLLPPGPLRDAAEAVERAEKPVTAAARKKWAKQFEAAAPEAVEQAEAVQRAVVAPADPDAADQEQPLLTRPNQAAPAFPLFRAASTHARQAVVLIGEAAAGAAEAVRLLLAEPGDEMLDRVRQAVDRAADLRVRANQAAADALDLKREGDETADRAAGAKNKGLEEARALEYVRKKEEGRRQDAGLEADEKRERASKKFLARVVREVVGNPFTPPRFDPAWRTETVLALARGIDQDRAWDRLPVLADALLDADCDEEPLLRHLRGTERWATEPPQHVRGCWAVELVLGRYSPLPPPAKGAKPRRRPRPADDDLDFLFPDDGTRLA